MRMSYKKGKDVKKKSKFGMLSVKAGIDKNPNPTQADRIAGAKMSDRKKANIGGMIKFKKILGGGSTNGKKRMDEAKAKKQDEFRAKKMGGGMMRKGFKKGGPGLYANINAKKKRIAAGSGEKMRKKGAKGAPTAKNFKRAKQTARS